MSSLILRLKKLAIGGWWLGGGLVLAEHKEWLGRAIQLLQVYRRKTDFHGD